MFLERHISRQVSSAPGAGVRMLQQQTEPLCICNIGYLLLRHCFISLNCRVISPFSIRYPTSSTSPRFHRSMIVSTPAMRLRLCSSFGHPISVLCSSIFTISDRPRYPSRAWDLRSFPPLPRLPNSNLFRSFSFLLFPQKYGSMSPFTTAVTYLEKSS